MLLCLLLIIFTGIDEVLKLLLDKGVSIDLLDANYDNALDIAIRRERHACIRVLLEHAHWKKLFLPVKNNKKTVLPKKNKGSHYIPNENRQMVALYDKKMWNEFEIILNKCVNKDFKGVCILKINFIKSFFHFHH